MSVSPYMTLGAQRAKLSARLGFGAAGAAAGVNTTLLNGFLQDAQTLLYWTHEWVRLRRYETVTTGAAQTLIDYPTEANPERIKAISFLRGGIWSPPLPRGIAPERYTFQSVQSWPCAWEPYDQIEIFPQTDQAYSLRIFYIKNLSRFTQDGDTSDIDDTLIFQLAVAQAKSHYRHPDAPLYLKQADGLLDKLKAKSWGQSKFNPNDYSAAEPLVMPQVTSSLGY